jgi:hypothetical protein
MLLASNGYNALCAQRHRSQRSAAWFAYFGRGNQSSNATPLCAECAIASMMSCWIAGDSVSVSGEIFSLPAPFLRPLEELKEQLRGEA